MWPALANGTYRELEKDETIYGINGDKVEVPKGTYCQIINCQIINWDNPRNLIPIEISRFNYYKGEHNPHLHMALEIV